MKITDHLNNSCCYEDHQNSVNECKKLKRDECVEPTTLGYFPKEIWMQIFTSADYQTYQQLSLCNSIFRKIYMDLNGNAVVYIDNPSSE